MLKIQTKTHSSSFAFLRLSNKGYILMPISPKSFFIKYFDIIYELYFVNGLFLNLNTFNYE